MTAHSTTANIHLHGPIEPGGNVRNRLAHDPSREPEWYAAVDLDKNQIASYVFLEDSAQAFRLAEVFRQVGHELATLEQAARKAAARKAAAAKAAAAEIAAPEEAKTSAALGEAEAEGAEFADTSDHYPSTEGV